LGELEFAAMFGAGFADLEIGVSEDGEDDTEL